MGRESKTTFVPFETSPFPYRGVIPGEDKAFLDVNLDGRLGHTSPRGGVYWEDQTYSDRRVLLSIPRGFDFDRPALIVLFFHGNQARLDRDVIQRQHVPRQLAESGLNAVLVAPQFAVDALDSSAGHFWDAGFFNLFLTEAAERLAQLSGDGRARQVFARAPVIIVAYSGGYLPAAFSLERGGVNGRIHGVILLDGLYAEEPRVADWIAQRQSAFFFSAFSSSTKDPNATLQRLLRERQVPMQHSAPPTLAPGSVTFVATAPSVVHRDFVTHAWIADPMKVVLGRIPGFSRSPRESRPFPRAQRPPGLRPAEPGPTSLRPSPQ